MHDNTPFLLASLLDSRTTYATAATHGSTDEHGSASTATAGAARFRDLLWSAVENILTHRGLSAAELETSHRALDWWEDHARSTDLPIDRARTLLDAWNLPEDTTYDVLHDEVVRVASDAWHADAHGLIERGKHELLADAMSDEHEGAYEALRLQTGRLGRALSAGNVESALRLVSQIEDAAAEIREELESTERSTEE